MEQGTCSPKPCSRRHVALRQRLFGLVLLFACSALATHAASHAATSLPSDTGRLLEQSCERADTDSDSVRSYALRAIHLAGISGDPQLRAQALMDMGGNHYRWSQPDSAKVYFGAALEVSREANHALGMGIALNRLGNAHWLLDEPEQALTCFREARAIHDSLGDPQEIGRTLNNLANAYRQFGDYQRAIRLYLESRDYYQQADYAEGVAWLNFSLAVLHTNLKDYDSALQAINASLTTYRRLARGPADSTGVMICYGQMGDIYNLMEQAQQGLTYHLRALELRKKTGLKPAIADGLSGVGRSYYKLGDYAQALSYFQRSQELRAQAQTRRGTGTSLKFMGAIYRETGQIDAALEHLQRGLETARFLGERPLESEILEMMAAIHASQGDFEAAWHLFQRHRAVQNQVMNAEISHRVASIQLQHRIAAQAAENERLLRENSIKDLQLARSQERLVLHIVLTLLAVFGVTATVYVYRKRLQLRTLRGLIPICAHCKKIRNGSGYYEQLEAYISSHADVQFTHGICEECARKYFPDFVD